MNLQEKNHLLKIEESEELHHEAQHSPELLQHLMLVHEQLNRMVLEGLCREEIIKTVGEILGSPIVVEDKELRPLAWWVDPAFNLDLEDCLLGSALNKNSLLQSCLTKMELEKKAIELVLSDNSMVPRTTAPIIISGEVMGYLSVTHVEQGNEVLRRMIIERAAMVIGIDLLKEQTKLETEHRLRGNFLDELLDETTPIESLRSRAIYMGQDLELPHRFLLVGIDPPWLNLQTDADQEKFFQILKKTYNNVRRVMNNLNLNVMVVERPKGILVLGNTIQEGFDPLKVAKAIQDFQRRQADELTVSVCISREASSINQLRTVFTDCKSTLEVMVRLGRVNETFFVDEMSMFDLFYVSSSTEELCLLAEQTLGSLLLYDEKYGGQFTETLHVYLMHECNLQRTKKELNISLSGLKYRLQRLQEIGEIDFDNPDERFNLQLALRILIANGKFVF
ncbi:PucR family transcriptional regulator [Sporosarcina soli]|uniref:PucR family transcriptional regulator n=1 Tax=Sporosarcina soli TaxID=334736 RepID=A0ABW0TIX7_9BACL